jgi:Glucosidase II beta subunit-like protein
MVVDEEEGPRKRIPVPLEREREGTASGVVRRAERLLASRLGDKCYAVSTGWWSYEVCFRESIRQFHFDGKLATNVHSLGTFNPAVSTPMCSPFPQFRCE